MDKNLNFNIQANSYVPKGQRNQQAQKLNPNDMQVVYQYESGKNYENNKKNYNKNQTSQYDQGYYQNRGEQNSYADYEPNYQKNNQNYSENYNQNYNQNYSQNYKKNYNQNYGQNYGQNYTQNYNQNYMHNNNQNYDQNNNQNYKQNYNKKYDQKYDRNYDQIYDQNNDNQNYNNQNYNNQNYNNQNYNDQNESYQQYDNNYYETQSGKRGAQNSSNYNNKISSGKQNTRSTPSGRGNQKYSNQSEEHVEEYQEYYDENFKGKNQDKYKTGHKTYIVEKDITNAKVTSQDLQDDLYDDDYYGGETIPHSELTGDLDDYEDDYGDYNEDFENNYDDKGYENAMDYMKDDYFEDTTKKMNNLKITSSATQNTNNVYNSKSTEDSKSKRHMLIFSNREGFTDYVEEITKKRYYSEMNDTYVNVLMIAEKPSIAKAVSEALSSAKISNKKLGKGGCIFNFDGYFGNARAKFTVSSVMGHVYTSDYQKIHNSWDSIDYLDLYEVPVEKVEANTKTRIPSTLQRLASGKDILCLWLDCDKEGENICYEVIYNTFPYMNKKSYQQVFRAKFSSLTRPDLKAAYNNIRDPPNKNESLSVDARQVIDLKIGVSFTRFLTTAVLPGIKTTADLKFLSYGPCQTPTLWFCVNRQQDIDKFISKEYFKMHAELEVGKTKHKVLYHKKFYDKVELALILKKIKDAKTCKLVNISTIKHVKQPPVGLNTVQMLRTASSYLKMSPHETMRNAEKLYTMGYITYPRTETTKYAASFDFVKIMNDYSNHTTFGKNVSALLKNFRKPVSRGVDIGDHPPITPSRVGSQADLKGDQWRLYEFICVNFFSSIADPAEYEEKVYKFDINGEIFEAEASHITKEGFLTFITWKKNNYVKDFPKLNKDAELNILNINSESHWTDPPENLTESDLLKLMEHNKIGTDASMAVHIENICARNYVKADASRKLIPTKLGKALIESLSLVDPELVQPSIRAEIENYVDQVAKGNKTYEDVLSYAVQLYKKKFLVVRQNYEKLLNSFKKYFEVDLMGMNKVYREIKNKNEALKIQNMVKKE